MRFRVDLKRANSPAGAARKYPIITAIRSWGTPASLALLTIYSSEMTVREISLPAILGAAKSARSARRLIIAVNALNSGLSYARTCPGIFDAFHNWCEDDF
jgi:hypothetical protein